MYRYSATGITFKLFWHAALYALSRRDYSAYIERMEGPECDAKIIAHVKSDTAKELTLVHDHGLNQVALDKLVASLKANNKILATKPKGKMLSCWIKQPPTVRAIPSPFRKHML